jgi:sulfur relay (sulfurtransferase) DsrF/TusC family protein
MTSYVFIESRDPFESRDARFIVVDTATALKQLDNEVTVFLVQNGVLASRKNAAGSHLPQLAKAGITLLADDFSLCERGIQPAELAAGIQPSSIDTLVEILVRENTKAIWH